MSQDRKYTNVGSVTERYVVKTDDGKYEDVAKGTTGAERQLSLNWNPNFKIIDSRTNTEVKVGAIPLFKFDLEKAKKSDKISAKYRKFLEERGGSILYDVAVKAPSNT